MASKYLAIKDFIFEQDEKKFSRALKSMVQKLAGSMALTNSRDQLLNILSKGFFEEISRNEQQFREILFNDEKNSRYTENQELKQKIDKGNFHLSKERERLAEEEGKIESWARFFENKEKMAYNIALENIDAACAIIQQAAIDYAMREIRMDKELIDRRKGEEDFRTAFDSKIFNIFDFFYRFKRKYEDYFN
jgi:Domain of unknown function (DUF3819)